MTTTSLGDLAHAYMMRQRHGIIKQDIARLTEELATGQTTQVRNLLIGNYAFLTDTERQTEVLNGYNVATTEAVQFTTTMQITLGQFSERVSELTDTMITAGGAPSGTPPSELAAEARDAFAGMINTLNTSTAGRQLFAGNATNQRPMADADGIIADLAAAIAGASTPADMIAQASAWFNNPAGFVASAYLGSDDPMTAFALSEGEDVTVDVRASDPNFFPALRGAAVAALATDPAFGLTRSQQAELFGLTAEELIQGQSGAITLQSRVGFAEARIDRIATRNAAEITSLTLARNALLEADPYETATKLEEAQFQLQSLYSLTVRMSQLSLVNYL